MRGLIIREPWIDLILSGAKTWEMRSTSTLVRDQIGLIRKGSKTVVGVARLCDSLPPLSTFKQFANAVEQHRIPPEEQSDAFERGWTVPWVLGAIRSFPTPVPYVHRSGAVTWVKLGANLNHLSESARPSPR